MATTTAAARENERKRGGGTGQEAGASRRVGTPRKKWKGGVHQVMHEREEREGVARGANGGVGRASGTDEEWDGRGRGRMDERGK